MSALLLTAAVAALAAAKPLFPRQDVNITSDAYFYGQSPPVYPSPRGTGIGAWADAYAKAEAFVAQLSQEEKLNLTTGIGYGTGPNGCSGNIYPIERLGFPGMCVNDAGNGLRSTDFGNSYPSGISVGASWNKTLSHARAVGIGSEFYKKGINVLLGPVVGPLGRVATGGRNFEGFSDDPYLGGALVYETVTGIQSQGVGVSTKHYIGNEQELNRNPGTVITACNVSVTQEAVSSNIDDKTLHELYLWPFQDAVLAGSVSIMCSYNRVNNSYGCQNSKTLNGILKEELGFQGYVMTDWGAQHSGVASANAGLDMVMPLTEFWGANLSQAIANGSVEQSRLDDMATRIMASWYQMGQDSGFVDPPGVGIASSVFEPHEVVIARNPSTKSILFDGAVEGHVLVKNSNNTLPLKSPKLLSLFGYDGITAPVNDLVSTISFDVQPPQIWPNGTLVNGGGSGTNQPAYVSSPYDAIAQQAYEDETSLLWNFVTQDPQIDTATDACLVFINAYSTEGFDRLGLADEYSDTLVNNVASNCSNTIVVIHNVNIRLVDAFYDHPNVTAIIYAHLPGQDAGRALVSILYGKTSPSGKLPYTVAKNAEDYGDLLFNTEPETPYGLFPQSDFDEGVFIDYRAFDKYNITPRFEFGFGLSYTTFAYSGLSVQSNSTASVSTYPPNATIVEGGNPHLWDILASVSATVSNTGSVDAAEVAQLYIGIPGGPVRQLRGFEKVLIPAGGSATVSFSLTRRDLSSWDVVAQQWALQDGEYQVYVGASSRDLPLSGTLSLGAGNATKVR